MTLIRSIQNTESDWQ